MTKQQISDKFIDDEGKEQLRATSVDFETLPDRHRMVIKNINGIEEDKESLDWLGYAVFFYDSSRYDRTLTNLNLLINKYPSIEPYLFYYKRVCERVLAVPLTPEEIRYEEKLAGYRSLPKWLKWTMGNMVFKARCKWCGRYTEYVDPNKPTFGMSLGVFGNNNCTKCGKMYPMPSWQWDSPDGRAYSYYRMSFEYKTDSEFYKEFEQDYDPQPKFQHHQNNKLK